MRSILLAVSIPLLSLFIGLNAEGQGVAVNSTGNSPDPSAILDASSSTQGALFPRMTTAERDAIASPAKGLIIYNTDCDNLNCNSGSPSSPNWVAVFPAVTIPQAPSAGVHSSGTTQITWNWSAVSGVDGYKWNTINEFSSATDNGTSTSYVQSGLNCSNSYSLYVWSYSSCGVSDVVQLSHATLNCPSSYCTVNSTCSGSIADTRDGKTYSVVQIGNQCWMGQNLNVGTYTAESTTQTSAGDNWSAGVQKYCYGDTPSNCDTYGGLYQWNEMMAYSSSIGGNGPGPQGICPSGWHLPTDNEWKCLETNVGMSEAQTELTEFRGTDEAGKLKEAGLAHWTTPNSGATNSSGFTALPGGWANGFSQINNQGRWASATEGDAGNAWGRYLFHNDARIFRYNNGKFYGFSVRCIKNA